MTDQNESGSLSLVPVLIGTGYAVAASLGISILLVLLTQLPKISEYHSMNMTVVHTAYGLCSVGAGWAAARRAGAKGWIYGLLAGLSFYLVTIAIGYFVPEPAYTVTTWWKKLAYALVGGTVGGISGIAWKE
ncbi:TIGR04086 family membrane protein [Heliobacterium chlorum]|uniref:TIGR04086 family membrane protein n=1 Tax=Heliobacterium chlorum TaxID=2698 RepID=A0ABR7T8B8_HELCL|nr:TIGR04086 family membrane protein [Heliobacterium chlorum]MBC9785981.1 TIGR04086 family membrane protein [Heliobacterium chlorum]